MKNNNTSELSIDLLFIFCWTKTSQVLHKMALLRLSHVLWFKSRRKEEWSMDHTHLYKRWRCGCWCSPPSCGSHLPCPAAAGHRRRPDVHLTRGQTSSSSSAARWCLIRWQQLETGSIYLFFCWCFVIFNYFLESNLIKYYIFNYIIK